MKTDRLYADLQQAIEKSPIIPPCQVTDPDLWFGSEDEAMSTRFRTAKNMCSQCPAIKECLAFALANDELYGVWGGLSPKERQALRVQHKRNQPKAFVKPFD